MDRLGLICRSIYENNNITQRELAGELHISLGTANHLIKEGLDRKLFCLQDNRKGNYELTPEGFRLLEQYQVDGALIIAAGFGSRFVPLTFEMPKGLLEVFGERMIERQIKQLHEVGIHNITIVVGYLKEKFEYLMDKYDVQLLYNPEYSCKNTLATIYRAREILKDKNMYVLSSDNWMRNNMFHRYECGAWYSSVLMEGDTSEWCLQYNKKGLISSVEVGGRDSWVMYGPVFFSKKFSHSFLPALEAYYKIPGTEQFYWEQVFLDLLSGEADKRFKEFFMPHLLGTKTDMYINQQPANQVYEFENLEELRQFDTRYQTHSDNKALELVSRILQVEESEIQDIRCLKSGMTNKSFLFKVHDKHYICRIPGPGTELLINRKEEAAVYERVKDLGLTEHIIYIDGNTGYKIAEYYEGARNADPHNWNDMAQCMKAVHKLHDSGLTIGHRFDVRERIQFYETLCKSHGSILFEDYEQVHGWMMELLDRLDAMDRPQTLAHIDDNVDNFLFLPDGQVRLIDWEYAGMCDPLIDVAMCAIYSYYNEEEVERLMSIYLGRDATEEERFVIYAYIAISGFLWSLWAVYKKALGEEFGEYTILMYRYAKKYYRKILKKS